ncbi:Gti1/Pac2 family transcription factor, partial [Pancytospora epiphaga]
MKKLRGYINSYDEAMMVMHAARLGALDVTTERLNIDEREKIESGDIFCFIENSSGMKRWTDGRIWSPSKICGEFLIYQEVPRHLSKNSIKKQKEIERIYDKEVPYRRAIRDESLDRTTMHK